MLMEKLDLEEEDQVTEDDFFMAVCEDDIGALPKILSLKEAGKQ
jgi:hypothetical protein